MRHYERFIEKLENRIAFGNFMGLRERALIAEFRNFFWTLCQWWPDDQPLPKILATASCERASRYYEGSEIIVHDEGLIDGCLAMAESLSRHVDNTPAAFVIWHYNQTLARLGCPHLALLVTWHFFPDADPDTDKGAIKPLDEPLFEALRRDCELELKYFDDEYFSDLRSFGLPNTAQREDSFAYILRTFVFFHEVSHSLFASEFANDILARLGFPDPGSLEEEHYCDLLAVIFTLRHVKFVNGFRDELNCSRLFGYLALAQSTVCDVAFIEHMARLAIDIERGAAGTSKTREQTRS